MNHARVQELLSAYLERELASGERAAVEAHLAGCAACGEDLESLRSAVGLLRRLPTPDPPPYLASRVMARIQDGEARPASWRRWLSNLAAPTVAASLAAAVAAAAVVYLAEPRREVAVASATNPALQGRPIVQRPVGPLPPRALVASAGVVDPQLARRLRGAGHPHSSSLAAHFEGPAEAVAVSWVSR